MAVIILEQNHANGVTWNREAQILIDSFPRGLPCHALFWLRTKRKKKHTRNKQQSATFILEQQSSLGFHTVNNKFLWFEGLVWILGIRVHSQPPFRFWQQYIDFRPRSFIKDKNWALLVFLPSFLVWPGVISDITSSEKTLTGKNKKVLKAAPLKGAFFFGFSLFYVLDI